jgi:alkanesulfonate monooxygenase SsuD/methylene tetrahydromethanopterin reductase-like flavin-dependent oxidoreductase (luciferase family)
MKIGVQLPEVEWEVPFPQLIEMAQAAESVGFDSVWYGDHLIYDLAAGARGPWDDPGCNRCRHVNNRTWAARCLDELSRSSDAGETSRDRGRYF